jgi:hypothetical protein
MRPAEVPDLRDALKRMWRSPIGMICAQQDLNREHHGSPSDEAIAKYMASEIFLLDEAEMYWASADMCHLLAGAAETLPSAPIVRGDLPEDKGFVVFDDPIPAIDAHRENDNLSIAAMEWAYALVKGQPAVHLGFYDKAERLGIQEMTGPLFFLGTSTWIANTELEDIESTYPHADERMKASLIEDRRLLHAFFLLISQRVTQVEVRQPDRAERRRAERQGRVAPPVRVVNLREVYRPSESPEGREVNWDHRWMVSGHWRQQWYASEQRHRPVFISPFVKGPADRPLVVRPKVNAWRK